MTRHLLFVCNNLNIGGPQKGLIGVLDRLDPDEFTCTIVSLTPGGALRPYLQERFAVLDVPPIVRAVQVNKASVFRDLWTLGRHGAARSFLAYLVALAAATLRQPVNPWRQRTWFWGRAHLPRLAQHFDAAFAVSSGLSSYYVVDCVNARRRYHWVVGDYSRTPIARGVDLHYFLRLSGGLAVSQDCADIFVEMFPEVAAPRAFRLPVPWRFYEHQGRSGGVEFDGQPGARILTVSRLEGGKGLDLALKAARILLDRGITFIWLILGDGDLRSSLEGTARSLGLDGAVRFCGFRHNVGEYLEAAEVFVLPSSSEGRSTAVDEAMAMGVVPVLTDYRTARSQVTDGVTGLISGFSPSDLADSIVRATEPSVREEIAVGLAQHDDPDPSRLFADLAT